MFIDSPEPDRQVTRTVPGETYIGLDETAGLPQVNEDENMKQRASEVVQVHRQGFLERLRAKTHRKHTRAFGEHGRPAGSTDVDVEKRADVNFPATRTRATSGILSSLLTLYQSDGNNDVALEPESTTTRMSLDNVRPNRTSDVASSGMHSMASTKSGSSHNLADVTNAKRTRPLSWADAFSFSDSRPSTARNGAGVFGALVASTANISGAAAPAPSTLAPSVKRPGYHLSR